MIVVLVETDAQGATLVSRETLTFARGLAERYGGEPLHALLVGPLDAGAEQELDRQLGEQGVQVLHHAQDDRLADYAAAAVASAAVDVLERERARLLVAPGSPRGNEVLAHVAARRQVLMAANVVAVDGTDPLVVSRQVVGGTALEEMRLDEGAVLTVAGHACDPEPAAVPGAPKWLPFSPPLTDADLVARVRRVEESAREDSSGLTSARVVVGAGRGAGGADGFDDLLELTELLGGALGVSRVVTSLGWRPHHEQVGQTGCRISPDLYVACGISGAIQHWAGCSSAKTILAINTDADAPMVTRAHYAVIGDLHEVVPAVNEEIRRRRAAGEA